MHILNSFTISSDLPYLAVTILRLGCSGFTEPRKTLTKEFGKSFFIPDDMINQHSRFRLFRIIVCLFVFLNFVVVVVTYTFYSGR